LHGEVANQPPVCPNRNIIGGYDNYWFGKPTKFTDADIKRVAEAGFHNIRVPLFVMRVMDKQGRIDPSWLKRLDHIIDLAHKNNLIISLDEHDFEECAANKSDCEIVLGVIWTQLAERYKAEPNSVVFELLNEPHGQIDADSWNEILVKTLAIVRKTNPLRNVIIGPIGYNSIRDLPALKVPQDDRHIIITFHYYDPFHFTHQGANWASSDVVTLRGVRWKGTDEEKRVIANAFDEVKHWADKEHRPIYLGEYGSYGKFNPNMDDRAAWTKAISEAADKRGFARAYWYYSDGKGFGAYDDDQQKWVQPIVDALTK